MTAWHPGDRGKTVEILLATRNGAAFLPAQLASIEAQQGVAWHVAASDDGSTDGTAGVLADFAIRTGCLSLRAGPGRGAAANFLSLLEGTPAGGYTALCDQDDLWLADRLERATGMLGAWDARVPRVYASRTLFVDAVGHGLGQSRMPRRAPGFPNALVQNLLCGNTIVMNAAARALVRQTARAARDVPFHDWWIYALLTGAGAEVVFDPRPGLLYRQHGANLIGAHCGLRATGARLRAVFDGRYGGWLRRNAEALSQVEGLLTADARATLARFERIFDARPWRRLGALRASGARRSGFAGQGCVLSAAALGLL